MASPSRSKSVANQTSHPEDWDSFAARLRSAITRSLPSLIA